MDVNDLDELRRLQTRCERHAGASLFHVTRIRFDAAACDPRELKKGWREFLGNREPFGFSQVETQAGPDFQQCCYYGDPKALDDYTAIAAVAAGCFPAGMTPILWHPRNPLVDREHWSLGLYRAAMTDNWRIAVDACGTGAYARFEIEPQEAAAVVSGFKEGNQLIVSLGEIRQGIQRRRKKAPTYLYAALVTDVFSATQAAIMTLIREVEAGKHAPMPGALSPDRMGHVRRPQPPRSLPQSVPADQGDSDWPPDGGWHFRRGEFAFAHVTGKLNGYPWRILRAIALSPTPITPAQLYESVWERDERSPGCISAHLTNLRIVLRTTFGLTAKYNPIPSDGRGRDLAWHVNNELLKSRAEKVIKATLSRKQKRG